MAKKRLNKKVAIIGSLVVAVLLVGCVLVLLRFTQNPAQYVTKGDEAFAKSDYEGARRYYGKAYGLSKQQEQKNELMFKLAEVFKKTDEWTKAVQCWHNVAVADKTNIESREYMVSYYYDFCDSRGYSGGVWNNVIPVAGELVTLKPSAELYFKKGRAELEVARTGGTTDQEKKLDDAIADLEEARRLAPQMMNAYEYLIQAYLAKSEMYRQKGVAKELADEAISQATKVVEKAIEVAPADPMGYATRLLLKSGTTEDITQMDALSPDFHALTDQFPNSALAHATLLKYYSSRPALFIKNIDLAVDTAEKAFSLEQTVPHALALCDVLYRRAYIHKDVKDIDRAIEVARKALELPDAGETSGPRAEGNKTARRLPLYTFLAISYLDKAMEWDAGDEAQKWVKESEEAAGKMEQIFGSGDNPYVLMWHGIIAYAKGQKAEGRKRMYAAYNQFSAADEWNYQSSQSAYWLARAHAGSGEDGAVFEFLGNAIKGTRGSKGTAKPDIILDFADMALKLRLNEYAVNVLDQYESAYGQTDRSRQARVKALLASGKVEDAAKLLEEMPQNTASNLMFRLQLADAEIKMSGLATDIADANQAASQQQDGALEKYVEKRIELIGKLMAVSPIDVDVVQIVGISNYLIRKGQQQRAAEMVDALLAVRPDDTALQLLRMRLNEPNPSAIPAERGKEMTLKVLGDIKDPFQRALQLGSYYAGAKENEEAARQYARAVELNPKDMTAINTAFDLAVLMGDFNRAGELAAIARAEDFDECKGQIYDARIAMMQGKFDAALPLLDRCIEQRPVFAVAYLFRSEVKDKLGMEAESINDASKAASIGPLGVQATKQLAVLLFKRNEKLGNRATAEQVQQAREALIKAVAANPADSAMLTYYIQSISQDRPDVAFSHMQRIYQVSPTTENAARLGSMAIKLAVTENDSVRKMAMMQIAGSVLEEAYRKDPTARHIVQVYADYYRAQGQADKADALIKSTNNDDIQWRYHLTVGQLDQARAILDRLYKDDPKNEEVVRGLIVVCQRGDDREGSLEYSRELIELDDSAESRLNYIQVLVTHNMATEAYKQIDSLKAKYPDEYRGELLRALTQMGEGKYAEARDVTNRVLQANQNDAGAWRLRGELDARLGDVAQAITSLQKSKLIADSATIRISLARAYLADGRENDAVEELRGAIPMEEGPREAASLLEQAFIRSNRVGDLKALYDAIIAKYPASYVWLVKVANYEMQFGDKNKALDYYRQAWRASEEAGSPYGQALNGWLRGLTLNGQHSDAIAFGSKYADGQVAAIALINMAEAAFAMQDKPKAMQYFEKALEKSVQDSTITLMVIDRMYDVLGQEDSTAWCNQRLQKDSKDIIANIAMYNVLLREGKADEALRYGDAIVALTGPKTEGGLAYRINNADILLQMYIITSDLKYQTAAIKALESLVTDLQGRPTMLSKVWNNLAYMLAASGTKLDDAAEYARKAYDAAPFDGNILDTFAFVLYKKGDYKEARERSRSAINIYEKTNEAAPPDVYERLGQISEKLGETQEAVAAYKRALEVGTGRLTQEKANELKVAIERLSSENK